MNIINLNQILTEHNLNVREVAEQLFPNNKYPRLALNRVIAGKASLDADQISKLALFTGRSIASLFSGEEWKAQVKKGGVHVFTNGDYRAELDTSTWITKVFHKGSLFHEEIIHSDTIPLRSYLSELDKLILKQKQNEN